MAVDFAKQREKMVDGQLRTTGVTSIPVLAAMSEVPREEFVPGEYRAFAYSDSQIPLFRAADGAIRFLMTASPFARLLQLAEIGKEDRVLDIGCATGYSSAVLSRLAGSVVALESEPELAAAARENLSRLGVENVQVAEGPLAKGHVTEAPYDVIFFSGSVEIMPEELFEQLREGGRLVCVVGLGNTAFATLWTRSGESLSSLRAFNAAVAPLPGFQPEPGFVF